MILDHINITSSYPTEEIEVYFDETTPFYQNERIGVHFRYFYFDTWDVKESVSQASGYVLSNLTDSSISANYFTELINAMELSPFKWDVETDREYLYMSFNDPSSAFTVWPSHPYPRITKVNNTSFNINIGLFGASAFDYDMNTPKLRKLVASDNLANVSFSDYSSISSNASRFHPFISKTRKNFKQPLLSKPTYNFKQNPPLIEKNIIDTSFLINVPTMTSIAFETGEDRVYFIMPFFDTAFTGASFSSSTTQSVLSTLLNISLDPGGLDYAGTSALQYPFTTRARIKNADGNLDIDFNYLKTRTSNIYATPDLNATVFCETSGAISPGGIQISTISDNNFAINVNPAVYSGYPAYLFNYRFTNGSRDLLTLTFQPSSYVVSSNLSSAVVRTNMIDSYYQNMFDLSACGSLAKKRFTETSGDPTVRAIDVVTSQVYTSSDWIPVTNDVKFVCDSNTGNKLSITFEVSSTFGAIYNEREPVKFLLNKDKVFAHLTITEYTDFSATVVSNVYPILDESYSLKYAAFPPENVTFANSNGEALLPNTFYPATLENQNFQVFNLGVDDTTIYMYTSEYEITASTIWDAPIEVFRDASIRLDGVFLPDSNKINYGTVSAFFVRNGLSYRVPTDANIIWTETANDERGSLTFYSTDFAYQIDETSVYNSANNFVYVNAEYTTTPVEFNPQQVLFNVACNIFRDEYDFNASKMFYVRQYPADKFFSLSAQASGDTIVYNSLDSSDVIYDSNKNITVSANYTDLGVLSSNLRWKLVGSDGATQYATGGDVFNLVLSTISACVTLSALSATPYTGNFKSYNFESTMCFYNFSGHTPFDFLAVPEYNYGPKLNDDDECIGYIQEEVGLENLTRSRGVSSLSACHTENFYLSATPGFDSYDWSIGNVSTTTTVNTAVLPVSYSNVSADNGISIYAYNDQFSRDKTITVYNSVKSNNSTIYKQNVNFYSYPSPDISITLSNNYYNIAKYSQIPNVHAEINSNCLDIQQYDLSLVLSGVSSIQTKQISDNRFSFNRLLTIALENNDFIIDSDSINNFAVFLTGNIPVTIGTNDFCPQTFTVSSNIVSLTAYSTPRMTLYAPKNIAETGETVWFYNGSNQNNYSEPEMSYTSFLFDNGDGVITSPTSSYFSTTYSSEGAKTPSLTGFLGNGETFIQDYKDLIVVKNSLESYDSSVTREFYEALSLPYSLEDSKIKPNEWQFASVFNSSVDKIKSNIQYLSAMCSVNNINFPKADGGFLGTRFGRFEWNTVNTEINFSNNYFYDLKKIQIVGEKMVCINGNKFETYNISETPSLISSLSSIGAGEAFVNPTAFYYSDVDKIAIILDSGKQTVLVCEFDIENPSELKLTHYWGGIGDRLDRTKLNNPVDLCVDSANNIYVVDKDSYIIKVYNKRLNWISNIEFSEMTATNRPISISEKDGLFSITTENNYTYLLNSLGVVQNSIFVAGATKSIFNNIHSGILYILVGNTVHKYTINGTFVSNEIYTSNVIDLAFDSFHGYSVFNDHINKFVDFIEIDRIINTNESLSGFGWDSIMVNEHEFVTDYIFNDSFKKIQDNIQLLNGRIDKKIYLEMDQYGEVLNQYISAATPSTISQKPIFLATNELALYDTINRGVEFLFQSLDELSTSVGVSAIYPNNDDSLVWRWNYHYIDKIQKPSLNKNPVTWKELKSHNISQSTSLSTASSWYAIREGLPGGNHSQLCWNWEQTQEESYFPLTWEELEEGKTDSPLFTIFTWEDLEKDCCRYPEFIFADCVSAC